MQPKTTKQHPTVVATVDRPPLQAEMEPLTLRQPLRHLPPQHYTKGLRSHPPQPSRQPSATGTSAEKSVRLPPSLKHHRPYLHRLPTTGEVSEDGEPSLVYHCGSDEGLRHAESRSTVENNAKIRLSRAIHSDGAPDPRWLDGARHVQRSRFKGIRGDRRSEAGLRPRAYPLHSYFVGMLMNSCRDGRLEIRIAYGMDGQLLNHRRMHFLPPVFTTTVQELLFADDCTLKAIFEGDMQERMNLFAAACDKSGLIINTEKTVVVHQPPPNVAYSE
nr:unnamed protein product [Spirometra erinaceieuropaei]